MKPELMLKIFGKFGRFENLLSSSEVQLVEGFYRLKTTNLLNVLGTLYCYGCFISKVCCIAFFLSNHEGIRKFGKFARWSVSG